MQSHDILSLLAKKEQHQLDKINQPITITELLVNYHKMLSYGEHEDVSSCYSEMKRIDRLIDHVRLLADIANQYHEDHCFSIENGRVIMLPTMLNHVTRISLNEYALFANQCPLLLDDFARLMGEIEIIARTMHDNLHLLLGSISVKGSDDRVMNYALYVTCGKTPGLYYFAKTHISPLDVYYPELINFQRVDEFEKNRSSEAIAFSTSDTSHTVPQNSVLKLKTAGGAEFTAAIDICLENHEAHSKKIFEKEVSSLQYGYNSEYIPKQVMHSVISNSLIIEGHGVLGQWVTQSDPRFGGIHDKNEAFSSCLLPVLIPECEAQKYHALVDKKKYPKTVVNINQGKIEVQNPPFGHQYSIVAYPAIKLEENKMEITTQDRIKWANFSALKRKVATHATQAMEPVQNFDADKIWEHKKR